VLFPEENIEFAVTGVYQVGSILTVVALSIGQSFSLRSRILFGFGGQFVCLAGIFAFRWLSMPRAALLATLYVLVALCSIATGYLDSALLALCSMYSSKMQQRLQIGIGLGTFVSVLYRDVTKALMPADIANATSFYFIVALATVLVCVCSYEVLMALPVSKDSGELGQDEKRACLLEDGVSSNDSGESQSPRPDASASVGAVWREVWRNQLVIFLSLTLTTVCYPGLITAIPCRQALALRSGHWYQEVLLSVFTVADICGRFATNWRCGLNHRNIHLTVVVRAVIFPLMLLCIMDPRTPDAASMLVVAAFGFLSGYSVSLALIVVNEVPGLSAEQRKTCGRMSACSVNGGLCLGSLAAAAVAASVGLTG